jgi:hypothetical protein
VGLRRLGVFKGPQQMLSKDNTLVAFVAKPAFELEMKKWHLEAR